MKNPPSSIRNSITPARRGQIIQRVLVDGWSSADAARSLGVHKHLVEVWVAEFRRRGMASLRQGSRDTISAELLRLTVPMQTTWRKIAIGLRRFFLSEPYAGPVPLRRSQKDGPRLSS